MIDLGTDNLRATSGTVIPPSIIILTAFSLISFVYTALGILSILTPPLCIVHQLWCPLKAAYSTIRVYFRKQPLFATKNQTGFLTNHFSKYTI
jgi:hypothetical protein